MGFNSAFKGLKINYVPRRKHTPSRRQGSTVHVVYGNDRCYENREKYVTELYGRSELNV